MVVGCCWYTTSYHHRPRSCLLLAVGGRTLGAPASSLHARLVLLLAQQRRQRRMMEPLHSTSALPPGAELGLSVRCVGSWGDAHRTIASVGPTDKKQHRHKIHNSESYHHTLEAARKKWPGHFSFPDLK